MAEPQPMPWSETDSAGFIEYGHIHTPSRDEMGQVILDLLPAPDNGPFTVVELGTGSGWLGAAVLARFAGARLIGLDGSPAMLASAADALRPFAERFDLRPFRLEDPSWLLDIPDHVCCFISSLVIHHLDGPGKQHLYRELYTRLAPGGGLIIADVVAPNSDRERHYLANAWDAEVRRQSVRFTGSTAVYDEFVKDQSNWYRYPDPMDMPSTVTEHLGWLRTAGFVSESVFWARAGHVVYGSYRATEKGPGLHHHHGPSQTEGVRVS